MPRLFSSLSSPRGNLPSVEYTREIDSQSPDHDTSRKNRKVRIVIRCTLGLTLVAIL